MQKSQLKLNEQIDLGSRIIGDNNPCFIIAEAGVAHFGSLEKCFKLVDLAKNSGADAIKFQIYDIDSFISRKSKKWFSRMREKLLNNDDFLEIQKYCKKKKILFFLTPHDEKALSFADKRLQLKNAFVLSGLIFVLMIIIITIIDK